MAPANARDFVQTEEYLAAESNYKQAQITPYASENIYYNFPIKSIIGYSTISCAVKEDGQYKGTASIVLYNKTQLEGMYSLNLEHGTQVFQYDGKGNSPTSPQLERKLEIQPLSFNLINNDGQEIPYDQIVNNGYVKWIIPNTQTLLKGDESKEHVTGELDITVTRADLPLAARDYNVYSNLSQFSYSIEDQYDSKKNINYIWLHIKYKDMQFDAYTNFTFPKDGDPGTNGTDFVAKIVPVTEDSLSLDTDRIYISNKEQNKIFDDSGFEVDKLKFQLYNNSRIVENIEASYWSCPPTLFSNNQTDARTGITTYLQKSDGLDGWNKPKIKDSGKTLENILSDKPVDIIRGQYNSEDGLRYFAEYPVCTQFVESGYRLKIRPKSGFKYAVYLEDGTRPDYDNTLPFEVVIQKVDLDTGYWERVQDEQNEIVCTWYSIGNIEPGTVTGKTASFKPKDTFDGSNLNSAVVVNVAGIGFLHVPIYMNINRYGHSALNGWDGNSIQLNANGDTILAPQIGAGKKQSSDNTFTGILMGDVKTANSTDTGIMGYDHGVRSIFMDAETGKTVLGKQGAGQITIDPRNNTARIYSGNYNYSPGTTAGAGMEIDLTDPHIRFGSGHFEVDNSGNITAKGGGTIAGWKISDTRLTSPNNNVYLSSNANDNYAIYSNGTFTVSPNGFMTSTSGKIAKWSIDSDALTDGNVGMGQGKTITANTFNNQSSAITNARIWSGTGTGDSQVTFAVGSDGKLWSKSGQIANWSISQNRLTDGNVGIGQVNFQKASRNSQNPFGEAIAARFWGADKTLSISDNKVEDSSSSGIDGLNFAVSNQGKLYSKAGKIGGWNIESNRLYSSSGNNGINLYSNGNINSTNYNTSNRTGYSINWDGSAYFYNIDARNGKIGSCNINNNNISGGTSSGSNWYINSDGTASFNNITASGGTIGGMTITGTTVQGSGGWYITNSKAYFPGLIVDANGVSSSSGGGISGGSGGSWSMPGTGAPSWNYGGKTMTPTEVKVIKKLTLKTSTTAAHKNLVMFTALDGGVKRFTALKDTTKITPHQQTGTVSIDGKTGTYTYFTYTLDKETEVVYTATGYYTIGDGKIVTGWGESTALQTLEVMASVPEDQSYGED